MSNWKCTVCGYAFEDGSRRPVCPRCFSTLEHLTAIQGERDSVSMVPQGAADVMDENEFMALFLSPRENSISVDTEVQNGQTTELSLRVSEHIAKNADKSAYIRKKIQQADEGNRKEIAGLTETLKTDCRRTDETCRASIQEAERKALSGIEVERAIARNKHLEWENGPKKKKVSLLSKMKPKSKISTIVGICFYVMLVLVSIWAIMQGESFGLLELVLCLGILFPLLSFMVATLTEGVVRFEKWFYRLDRRKQTIDENKRASTNRSFEETMTFLNNQEMQIRNRTSEDDSLPCVREFQETANELTEKAEEEKARYRRNNEKAIAEANRRWDERRRSMVNDWISEATQAGVSCAQYFEYMYQELGMNRGPAFWLAFRFCGRDGVIASSPRGISQLRTKITIHVAVSEKQLYVTIKDINGKELMYDEEERRYQFNRVNQADLTEPAERYGYSCALMYCTVQEARKELEQARFDRSFELRYGDMDLDGFTITYDGSM